ncbi:hypothetical protein CYY_003477 [Polysphondylium violaceum]|uniref:Transmembrane protein n=1 Tax=Polysphondylium violaceum TaxID=133409 RepID=A0A8J4PWY1_9MYCE|nr:hypothetical protein CYY_003477 [Polysphondylium violaceum]
MILFLTAVATMMIMAMTMTIVGANSNIITTVDSITNTSIIPGDVVGLATGSGIAQTLYSLLNQTSSIVSMIAIFSGSYVAFFLFGWFYLGKILFRDYEVKRVFVQLSFATTFALSLTLFELIFFEIMDVMDRE